MFDWLRKKRPLRPPASPRVLDAQWLSYRRDDVLVLTISDRTSPDEVEIVKQQIEEMSVDGSVNVLLIPERFRPAILRAPLG